MFPTLARAATVFASISLGATIASAQLNFSITNQGAATPQMLTGFAEAAAMWSARLNDPVTINLRVNAGILAAGQIAGTSNFFDPWDYSVVTNTLLNDRQSADDFSSTSHLQAGTAFSMLINRTANSPTGVVSATPYFDTGLGGAGQAGPENNQKVRITSANAKALGLIAGNSPGFDGTITFSTQQTYDFDRSNGITGGQIDFVGAAAHEIGHLLGFMSGVDNLDRNGSAPGLNDNQLRFVAPLDLFRFSSRSIDAGGGLGVIDWTADPTTKYFSVDGGATSLANFATGVIFGDTHEPHHWKNGFNTGLMDPTAGSGVLLAFSAMDLRAMDVIGWNLVAAPEPSTFTLLLFTGLAGIRYSRRRVKRRVREPVASVRR